MIVIVLGFASSNVREEPQALYVGTDAKAANDILLSPPAGILRTEIFKNPRPDRRRIFEAPSVMVAEEVPAAEEVAAEVETEVEAEPENIVDIEPDVPMPAGDAEADEKPGKGRKK